MSRVTIEIDDEACAEVMHRFSLSSVEEAVNVALRRVAFRPFTVEEARAMQGSGWDGDLSEMRSGPAW
jgi:Arc/MetJ family transcription regulator